MWAIRTITSYQAERRQMSKRRAENTAERKARAERLLTQTLLLQRRHVERGTAEPKRLSVACTNTTIHSDTQRCTRTHTHKHAQQAGCGSVTHFELYRTKSFVFFFTEQTHNKTRDEEHNKQQEQQLKAARRCEDARTEGLTIHSARDNWTLAVWSTLTTWRNAASLVSTN